MGHPSFKKTAVRRRITIFYISKQHSVIPPEMVHNAAKCVTSVFLNGKRPNLYMSNTVVVAKIEEAIMYRGMRPWLYNDIIFNLTSLGKKFNSNLHIVHELSKKVLKQKIDKLTNKDYNLTFDNKSNKYSFEKKIRKPFLELLLEYHLKDPSFTEEDVREEVDTFMFAVKYTFPFYTLMRNTPAQ
ncbi:hypothetical protein AVEN_14454-1 [Araneus ventricosus]|uniref:Cytochrome P450 4C1 n=1 Tax=Araneus ventricosus TaxID=182803 RepID=A0A4Y2RZM8_ARAVE|nr:hypothetical protein AVEN_250817-1 [Araneus ventricosus]GBN81361.1 hypothetical protein AVEN_14454-1 [Araneus ventricosus]